MLGPQLGATANDDLDGDAPAKAQVAVLTMPDGSQHEIKVMSSSVGDAKFLDIRTLHTQTGYLTYDPGFSSTASCTSCVTHVDGAAGKCLYRGYDASMLARKASFVEVAHLLLTGELPSRQELQQFNTELVHRMLVHEKMKKFMEGFQINSHPMAVLVTMVASLSAFFSELDIFNCRHRWLACVRLIAKLPTLAAMAYKTSVGQPYVYPRSDLSYAGNFLHMMFATPLAPYKVNPIAERALDMFLTLHADHEQNASTSTVRTAASSMANPYACVAAGVASLWGPAHGGANQAVMEMLQKIGTKQRIPEFLDMVKRKQVRLMGFGHRIYKSRDPRATAMKELCHSVLQGMHVKDPQLELAMALEEAAVADEYFAKRHLYPNVDFYSGIVLRALAIPVSMYTVLFAVARTTGWICHWKEMVEEGAMKINRPRQLYAGEGERDFVPISERREAELSLDGDTGQGSFLERAMTLRSASFRVPH